MIKTIIDQNENGVYMLKVYINDKLVLERFNDHSEIELADIAGVAEEMYEIGYDDGYWQAKEYC